MNYTTIKNKLKELKSKLEKEIDLYKKEDPYLLENRSISNTLDDDITETEGHDRIYATQIQLTENLRQVQEALKRIEEGKYGICKRCGQKINSGRLGVMPQAVLCINCQSKVRQRS